MRVRLKTFDIQIPDDQWRTLQARARAAHCTVERLLGAVLQVAIANYAQIVTLEDAEAAEAMERN